MLTVVKAPHDPSCEAEATPTTASGAPGAPAGREGVPGPLADPASPGGGLWRDNLDENGGNLEIEAVAGSRAMIIRSSRRRKHFLSTSLL
jgi:hypothetical protein